MDLASLKGQPLPGAQATVCTPPDSQKLPRYFDADVCIAAAMDDTLACRADPRTL